jgi:hypothetical protein
LTSSASRSASAPPPSRSCPPEGWQRPRGTGRSHSFLALSMQNDTRECVLRGSGSGAERKTPLWQGSAGAALGARAGTGALPKRPGSRSSKNGSGFGSSGGVAFLMKLKPFWKPYGKTASPVGLML